MRANEFLIESLPKLTPQQQQEVADLYVLGFSASDIGKDYKVGKDSILSYMQRMPNWPEIKQANIQRRNEQGIRAGPRPTPDNIIQQMVELFKQGQDTTALGRQFRLSTKGIRDMFRRLPNYDELYQQNARARQSQGLPTLVRPGTKGITPDQVQQMAQLFSQGQDFVSIGKKFNVTRKSVSYWLKKLPNYAELYQQNQDNRLKKLSGKQAITTRMINKPLSKGIHAVRTTGPATGGRFKIV